MKETLKHQEAFDYYYALGKDRSLKAVAEHFSYGVRTVEKWSSEFSWQDRIHQRDQKNAEKLECITNETIIEAKTRYLRIVQDSIKVYTQNLQQGEVKINSVQDLERLVRLEIELRKEDTTEEDKVVNIFFTRSNKKPNYLTDNEEDVYPDNEMEISNQFHDEDVLTFDPKRDLRK